MKPARPSRPLRGMKIRGLAKWHVPGAQAHCPHGQWRAIYPGGLEAGSSQARLHKRRGRQHAGVPFSSSDHELIAALAASTQGPQVASFASTHSAITSSRPRFLLSISSISAFWAALSIDMTSISL